MRVEVRGVSGCERGIGFGLGGTGQGPGVIPGAFDIIVVVEEPVYFR